MFEIAVIGLLSWILVMTILILRMLHINRRDYLNQMRSNSDLMRDVIGSMNDGLLASAVMRYQTQSWRELAEEGLTSTENK